MVWYVYAIICVIIISLYQTCKTIIRSLLKCWSWISMNSDVKLNSEVLRAVYQTYFQKHKRIINITQFNTLWIEKILSLRTQVSSRKKTILLSQKGCDFYLGDILLFTNGRVDHVLEIQLLDLCWNNARKDMPLKENAASLHPHIYTLVNSNKNLVVTSFVFNLAKKMLFRRFISLICSGEVKTLKVIWNEYHNELLKKRKRNLSSTDKKSNVDSCKSFVNKYREERLYSGQIRDSGCLNG